MSKKLISLKLLLILSLTLVFMACNNTKKPGSEKNANLTFPDEMINFTPANENPVFKGTATNTWDKYIRERGFILFENNKYKMWYSGYNPDFSESIFLGYATSPDGINWTRYSDKPVFNKKWTEDMFVIKFNNLYYMYAEGKNDVAHLLVSKDGIRWQEKGDLVIQKVNGEIIAGPYGTPTVWIEDGKWYLFYEKNDKAIWLAQSTDKINWVNVQDEPVIKLGPDAYDIGAVAANQVVKYKERYFIYYHATTRADWQNPSSHVDWTSNVAMSTDLVHWEKYSGNPIIKGDYSSPILVFDSKKPSLYTMHPAVHRYLQNTSK